MWLTDARFGRHLKGIFSETDVLKLAEDRDINNEAKFGRHRCHGCSNDLAH
jgi:hypothetical protein